KEVVKLAVRRKTGARGLRAIMEKFMTDIMYQIPSISHLKSVTIHKDCVVSGGKPRMTFAEPEDSTVKKTA
ncbi:MAG TPA: ATP-dependent Clp protease ATP-binding subunit ClpX, partial [bacterium]|nr:ATP-dependent Clp protease ATP-binding subunit ClpX [bacterium]